VRGGVNVGIEPAINLWDVNGGLIERNIAPMFLENKLKPSTGLVYIDNVDTWDTRSKRGVQTADLFTSSGEGDLDFSRLNPLQTSVAGAANAGFRASGEIGNYSGSAATQLASLLPTFEQNFAVFA
jgi:hypothetical protein